jgi:hypothetical protein
LVSTSTSQTRASADADASVVLLVNSTDSFAETWGPFFHLISDYWPRPLPRIVLNTETLDFAFPGMTIVAARVAVLGESAANLTWSECLARCLADIETPYVLYMQDDFFLYGRVNGVVIDEVVREMARGQLDCVRLLECEGAGPWAPSGSPLLWDVDPSSKYLVSLQAAVWRRESMLALLRKHESAWQFEVFGSRRAFRAGLRVCCLDRDRFGSPGNEVVPYAPTGIIKGRWNRDAVEGLFAEHGLRVDYSQRGWYDPSATPPAKASILRRLVDRARSWI